MKNHQRASCEEEGREEATRSLTVSEEKKAPS